LHSNFNSNQFFSSQAAFEEFGVMPEIIKSLEELGWELPRDIQAEAIPLILGGGDVMAVSATYFNDENMKCNEVMRWKKLFFFIFRQQKLVQEKQELLRSRFSKSLTKL
jgi:hypothetical protein